MNRIPNNRAPHNTGRLQTDYAKLQVIIAERNRDAQEQSREVDALRTELHAIYSSKKFRFLQMIAETTAITKKLVKNPTKLFVLFAIVIKFGPSGIIRKVTQQQLIQNSEIQYKLWLKRNTPTERELERERNNATLFPYQPVISIITPTYNTPPDILQACIESVINQTYQNWQLCIADDASTSRHVVAQVQSYAKKDQRICFITGKTNGHIVQASNGALKLAKGTFIGFLDHDDILQPNALFEVVSALNKNRALDIIYSDEDKISLEGARTAPFFKPDWSPEMFFSCNYLGHFTVVRQSIIGRVGGFRKGFEGAQDYDLLLRVIQQTNKIYHIPKILYSWRKTESSTAANYQNKKYAENASIEALRQALKNRKTSAVVRKTNLPGVFRVEHVITKEPLISIIIPTKDKVLYLKKCLASIQEKTRYQNYEIIVVDTGSVESATHDYYQSLSKSKNMQLLHFAKPFNYSAVNNFAVKKAQGQYVVLLNNDTEVISSEWLSALLEFAQQKNIGAVGAKLLYPNNTIQHAGIILGLRGGEVKGVAGHSQRNMRDDIEPYAAISNSKDMVRNFTAVTAACLMIKKEKYWRVNGMDEDFAIAFNDVDFCLKLYCAGLRNVYTPYAKLYHHESVSIEKPGSKIRDINLFYKEIDNMHQKWGALLTHDPFFNPNYSLRSEVYDLDVLL